MIMFILEILDYRASFHFINVENINSADVKTTNPRQKISLVAF